MRYNKFKNILDKEIFNNSKKDLLEKISKNPDRYIGLFRPTKAKAKILQNLLQSNEIRFGDALEKLFGEYFTELGYKNLNKKLNGKNKKEYFDLDQLFTDGKYIYFVEQKVRDDHDSTKKRGQIDNFEKKIIELLKIYKETEIKSFTYFIDPSLIKNKNFYSEEIEKIERDYNIYSKLCYGEEFWEAINHKEIWKELLIYLELWKKEIPDMPSVNFDENPQNSFDEIKNMTPNIFRKIFENTKIYNEILPVLFPDKKTLKLLKEYFVELGKTKTIYKNLSDKINLN